MRVNAGAVAILALFAGCFPCSAQVLYGSLVGNIKDPSDAALPGVRIVLTNVATSQSRETITNDAGLFNFPTLLPGNYELRATKEGFRVYAVSGVTITVNTVSRHDVSLQLGAVTEVIDVSAQSSQLQTDRAEVRSEVTTKQIISLPVSAGRNYQQLFRTLPGFRPPTNAHSVPTNPSRALTFNVNGASQSINNTRIDGASSIAPWLPHATAFVPTLESIEVVNVVTNSFDAEQGLAGGAAVNVSIKSGTNDLHGSAFEYHSNNNLKAKNFFLPAGQDNPKLVLNEFGGSLGGPIRRNKLFFFASYEGNYNREFASRFGTVPTPAMKRGDMSESPRQIYDPGTGDSAGRNRTPFAGKQIPTNQISPIIRKLVDLTPDPNQPGLTNNYFAADSYRFDRHRVDSKVNWNVTDKLSAFGRYSILHYDMANGQMFGPLGGPEISSAGGNPGAGTGKTHSFTGAATYIIRPNLIVDAYFGWTRMDTSVEQARLDEKLGSDFLGIPGTNGPRRFEGGWPRFDISGFTVIGHPNDFMPYKRSDPQFQYVANFNWTKNSHDLRFGMDLYQQGMNHTQPEATGANHGAQGGFTFGGGPTLLNGGEASNSFNSYSAFLLGLPTNAGKITLVPDQYSTRATMHSVYVRDRWNATRKLTLSYGLRWEYFPFPTRADRGLELYDPTTNRMSVCGVGSVPRDCGVEESKRKFAPRVGMAYRVAEGFVLRAGYGLTNDPFSLARPFRTNYPMLIIQNIDADAFQTIGPIARGIPQPVIPDLGNGVIEIPGTYAVITVDKNFKRGYVQSWNFTVQKQMRWGFVGQAGYVATRSTNQMGYLDLNAGQFIGAGNAGRPLRQQFGRNAATTIVRPFGTNTYDSLQATLERRFAQGVALNVAYTWSKAIGWIDNNDSEPSVRALAYFSRNRTVRSYDRPHNLQISNIWELPFGKGRRLLQNDGILSRIAGGWQVNNILSFFSGTPFTVTSDGASLNLPGSTQTADQVKPTVQRLGGVGRGLPFYDPDAFGRVRDPRFGNTAMNLLRGPGYANWDFSLFRRFRIREGFAAEFRAEAFNFTNTPHFSNPGGSVSNYNPELTDISRRYGGFMEITSTANVAGRDNIDERQFRLGLRLSW